MMMSGFGNHFATEAVPGALPVGRNSPQKPAFGLYAEQLSGTAFTMARAENRRSWLYRLRPSVPHGAFALALDPAGNRTLPASPNRLRWDPRPSPEEPTSFHDSVMPVLWNGDPEALTGVTVSTYAATQSMGNQAFFSADGEMLIIPEHGRLRLTTEMGIIDLEPLEIAIIPRGVRYRVELPDGPVRGYLCENHGAPFRLPDLGPIGTTPTTRVASAGWLKCLQGELHTNPRAQIVKDIHEVDVRVVRAVVGAEVLVHVTVGPVLGAHVVEVVAGGELAPILKNPRIAGCMAGAHSGF
jgi:homogentisate 1,2-dioxygenase